MKREVSEVLEECVWDEKSRLFQLRGIWDSGGKVKSIKSKILKELEGYWKKLARQGRTLEEAARSAYNHLSDQVTNHWIVHRNCQTSIVSGLPVMGFGSVVVKTLRATLSWQY